MVEAKEGKKNSRKLEEAKNSDSNSFHKDDDTATPIYMHAQFCDLKLLSIITYYYRKHDLIDAYLFYERQYALIDRQIHH